MKKFILILLLGFTTLALNAQTLTEQNEDTIEGKKFNPASYFNMFQAIIDDLEAVNLDGYVLAESGVAISIESTISDVTILAGDDLTLQSASDIIMNATSGSVTITTDHLIAPVGDVDISTNTGGINFQSFTGIGFIATDIIQAASPNLTLDEDFFNVVAAQQVTIESSIGTLGLTAGGDIEILTSNGFTVSAVNDVFMATDANIVLEALSGTGIITLQASEINLLGGDALNLTNARAVESLQLEMETTSASGTMHTSPVVAIDATAGNVTATLPLASANLGKIVYAYRSDATGNTVSIARSGSDLINSSSSYSGLTAQFKYVTLYAAQANLWVVLGSN